MDEKQLEIIAQFCSKPYSQHGKQRTSGEHDYDWAQLVRESLGRTIAVPCTMQRRLK